MIEKESRNFHTRFYGHLWLLQGSGIWVWGSQKLKLGKFLTDFFWNFFSKYLRANSNAFLIYPMLESIVFYLNFEGFYLNFVKMVKCILEYDYDY